MATISEALAIALNLHQSGRLREAEQIYRQILTIEPDHADAQHLLGVVAFQFGNHEAAIRYINRAIELNGNEPAFHFNLGAALKTRGNLAEAVVHFQHAVELKPDYAEAHNILGNAFRDQGSLDEAINAFRRALQLQPDYAEAHNNLGTAFQAQGKPNEAAASFRRALELKPEFVEAHSNLGAVFNDLNQPVEAAACLRRALELQPNLPEALNNLGNALRQQGKLDEAIASYSRALELKADYAEAHNNLGQVLRERGKLDDAVSCYRQALELRPAYAEAHNNLGNACKDQGKLDESIASFRRAIQLKADFVAAHSNLIYTLYFSPAHDAAAIFAEHCLWSRQHAEPVAKFIRPHGNSPDPNRRLRIGYVSPNFRTHAQAHFLVPLLCSHDHERFEIFCYADVVLPDQITARLRSCSDRWRTTTGLSDEDVGKFVRNDRIDILVDLTLHMGQGRPLLFARKPAPVQVCWLAYQGTTGLSTVDYRLTDLHLDPPGLFDRYYTEKSVRLRDSFWCYDPLADEPAVNPLPAFGNGYVTFGSLNNFCKVTDDVLRLWARVLKAVDHSRLMILAEEGSHRQRMLDFVSREGVSTDRIEFVGYRPRSDYLKLHHRIDIGLDTFPYNGQTTTLDALWMGVPVVTIIGTTSAARAGASLLRTLGMPELVADSPDAFESNAVNLAKEWKPLAEKRASLRQRLELSPLMDAPRFARSMEAAYRGMWREWCKGGSLASES